MGTFANILQDWSIGLPEKEELFGNYKGILLRWLNEAQLRYADKSEVLTEVWSPTITSTGNIALPTDFLREVKDRVKWSGTRYLVQADYPSASINSTNFSGTNYYSIWEGVFYVWAASAGTPSIPYIKTPAIILIATILTSDLEIPLEFQHDLLLYLDAMFERRKGDYAKSKQVLGVFDEQAALDGLKFRQRREPPPVMRSSRF